MLFNGVYIVDVLNFVINVFKIYDIGVGILFWGVIRIVCW